MFLIYPIVCFLNVRTGRGGKVPLWDWGGGCPSFPRNMYGPTMSGLMNERSNNHRVKSFLILGDSALVSQSLVKSNKHPTRPVLRWSKVFLLISKLILNLNRLTQTKLDLIKRKTNSF